VCRLSTEDRDKFPPPSGSWDHGNQPACVDVGVGCTPATAPPSYRTSSAGRVSSFW
jgi:hypothetical protein